MFSGDELMCDLPSWIDLDMVSQSVYSVNPGDKLDNSEGTPPPKKTKNKVGEFTKVSSS